MTSQGLLNPDNPMQGLHQMPRPKTNDGRNIDVIQIMIEYQKETKTYIKRMEEDNEQYQVLSGKLVEVGKTLAKTLNAQDAEIEELKGKIAAMESVNTQILQLLQPRADEGQSVNVAQPVVQAADAQHDVDMAGNGGNQ